MREQAQKLVSTALGLLRQLPRLADILPPGEPHGEGGRGGDGGAGLCGKLTIKAGGVGGLGVAGSGVHGKRGERHGRQLTLLLSIQGRNLDYEFKLVISSLMV